MIASRRDAPRRNECSTAWSSTHRSTCVSSPGCQVLTVTAAVRLGGPRAAWGAQERVPAVERDRQHHQPVRRAARCEQAWRYLVHCGDALTRGAARGPQPKLEPRPRVCVGLDVERQARHAHCPREAQADARGADQRSSHASGRGRARPLRPSCALRRPPRAGRAFPLDLHSRTTRGWPRAYLYRRPRRLSSAAVPPRRLQRWKRAGVGRLVWLRGVRGLPL